ncbi:TetR family transcriptional regulator [Actinocrispum wychmicini]|uniref:TetR family transcriptional regulator n=1 Tax=Actinocrispum wychmicini TaxID=1213861 RepID=A0A4V2S7M6_9PSEU|nr:TetR family transcriptional regulator [Actinocrispum wychmicini]TCO60470.1 TetR family transcriptional regulator [Actinocrispum wychmicini]
MPDQGERPLGLRARKKIETRQALADAAIKLSVERGFENVTVEDIAVRAGVSTRTFFNYFPSKEDAVLRPDPDPIRRTQQIIDSFAAAPPDVAPARAFAMAMRSEAEQVDRAAAEWLIRISIIERDPAMLVKMFTARAETERMAVEAIAARTNLDPATDLYPELIYHAVGAAFRTAMKRWYALGGVGSLTALFDEAVDLLISGLSMPPGSV